ASREDLKAALRAGAWLPIAAGPPVSFRGGRALDGGVLLSHPFRLAVADGCTHVLSLSTLPRGRSRRSVAGGRVIVRWLDRLQPGLGAGYVRALRDDTADRRFLARARTPDGAGGSPPFVLDVAPPPGTPGVKRYELRPDLLLDGARGGYQALVLAVEGRTVAVTPRLTIPDPGLAPAARPSGVAPPRPDPAELVELGDLEGHALFGDDS
nr:hypothetical protein [Actinomycetota bacterium]